MFFSIIIDFYSNKITISDNSNYNITFIVFCSTLTKALDISGRMSDQTIGEHSNK
jgi:hypothetical protein